MALSIDPIQDQNVKRSISDIHSDGDVRNKSPTKRRRGLEFLSYTESWAGAKETNEDRFVNTYIEDFGNYYGLYDGHGGSACADYLVAHLHKNIRGCLKKRGLLRSTSIFNQDDDDDDQEEGNEDKTSMEERSQTIKAQIEMFESEKAELERLIAEGVEGASFVSVVEQLDMSIAQLCHALEEIQQVKEPPRKNDSFPSDRELREAIVEGYEITDANFLALGKRRKHFCGGSTALSIFLLGNIDTEVKLVVANLGDCRAVLCSRKKAVRLTSDHKPDRPDEMKRIQVAGGFVGNIGGTWRVCNAAGAGLHLDRPQVATFLAVSRAFGDGELKSPSPLIICKPEVSLVDMRQEDLFVIIACDGIWDVMDDQTAVDIVRKHFGDPKTAATELVRAAYRKGSQDNLTVTVVFFGWKAALAEVIEDTPDSRVENTNNVDEGDVDMFNSK